MLQAARRELCEECGPALEVNFISNTPSAYFSYKYTSPSPNGIIGSKVNVEFCEYRAKRVQLAMSDSTAHEGRHYQASGNKNGQFG